MIDVEKEKCPSCKEKFAYLICKKESIIKVNENLEKRLSFRIYFCEKCNDVFLEKASLLEETQISPYANIGSSMPGQREIVSSNEIEESTEPINIKKICSIAKERAVALSGKTHTKSTPIARSIKAYIKVYYSKLLDE